MLSALSVCDNPAELAVAFGLLFVAALILGLELAWLSRFIRSRIGAPRPAGAQDRFWPWAGEGWARILTMALHAAAVAILVSLAYARWIEPSWIKVETVEIESAKIRSETGRVRVVHLSDIHSDGRPRNEERAVELVRGLKPDLIALTGDYLNDRQGLPLLRSMIAGLAATAPVFIVTGNHDHPELGHLPKDAFDGLRATVLNKTSSELDVRGTRIRLYGMAVRDEALFPVLMRKYPRKPVFDIFLHHYSDSIYHADKAGMDLYLSGHTHGGQIRLPFYGAVTPQAKFGKRFEAGLYRVGRTALYVNRGLGLEIGDTPKMRFLCRPEVTVIDLVPAP